MIILGLPFVLFGGSSAEFKVIASVNSDAVVISDPIILSVELQYPSGYAPDLMMMKQNLTKQMNPLLPRYRVIKETIQQPKQITNGMSQLLSYKIEPLTLGSLSFSLLNILFIPIDEKNKKNIHEVFSEVLSVRVDPPSPIQGPPEEIGSLAPLLRLKSNLPLSLNLANRDSFLSNRTILAQEAIRNQKILSQRSFPWMSLILLVGIALLVQGWRQLRAYLAWKKQQRPSIDPKQKALESISQLSINLETAVQDDKVLQDFELESLLMGGDHSQKVKAPSIRSDYGSKDCGNLSSSTAVSRIKEGKEREWYEQLTEILRTYIEETYHINVHEQTTEEFLAMARQNSSFSSTTSSLLSRVFYTDDIVKFAHYHPSRHECDEALAAVKSVIIRGS
jgi:hypothetical protein